MSSVAGDERVDYLAFSTKYYVHRSPFKISASVLLPPHEKYYAMHDKPSGLPSPSSRAKPNSIDQSPTESL